MTELTDKEKLEKAIAVIEDFLLEDDHADFCHFKTGQICRCMDRGYYNRNYCLIRAKEFMRTVS